MNNNYNPSNNISNPNFIPNPQNYLQEVEPEQSYVENILRLNKGKVGRFYMSFPDSVEWRDRIFTGVLEQAGRDHIIISNPQDGKWYLLLAIYLDYVEFDEKINYSSEFYYN